MIKFKILEIIPHFANCKFIGDEQTMLSHVIALRDVDPQQKEMNKGAITWVSDGNVPAVSPELSVGLLILSESAYADLKKIACNFLIAENPRLTFLKLLSLKFSSKRNPAIEKTAVIHETAKIGKNCYIGHQVVIEENVVIGDATEILHNTVILKDTLIGNNVHIGCNSTIGNYGFGYEKDKEGNYILMTHIGNVKIEDFVEIGNNTAIDRAVMGSTWIKKNVKIDNLVHIAHGVEIGENSLIIANAMIAGSVRMGENVWVAPSASIVDRKEIAKDAFIGMGAVVLRDVKQGDVIVGNPGKSIKKD